MPQPYNYMLNLPNPSHNLMDTVSFGLKARAAQQDMATAQAAQARARQAQTDLAAVWKNPTPSGLAGLMTKYPELSEQYKSAYEAVSAEHQRARVDQASQVYAALQAGQPEIAQQLLQEQATAYRNSGMEQEAKAAETISKLVAASPKTAQASTGAFLAASDPEKFAETFGKLQAERRAAELQPAAMTEAQAKAKKAATEARFAESTAAADLASKGWDVSALITDPKVARENSRIAALQAEAARTDDDLKRQQLQGKVADAQQKRDQTLRDRKAAVTEVTTIADNSLATIDRLLANPGLNDVTGPIAGSEYYPSVAAGYSAPGFIFGASPGQRTEALADLETVESQIFLDSLNRLKAAGGGATGLGQLTEKEGRRLVTAVTSLNRRQPTESVRRNLKTVRELLVKSKQNVARKYGAPETLPPAAPAQSEVEAPGEAPGDINELLRKHGGP